YPSQGSNWLWWSVHEPDYPSQGSNWFDLTRGSRPGGPMAPAVFQSNSTGTTFRLVADNSTVADLMPDITANCSHFLVPTSISVTTPMPFNASRE
ncbi:hypothetical protein B0H14DRAFT_2856771, partial [Mycena olivaceomarginata]